MSRTGTTAPRTLITPSTIGGAFGSAAIATARVTSWTRAAGAAYREPATSNASKSTITALWSGDHHRTPLAPAAPSPVGHNMSKAGGNRLSDRRGWQPLRAVVRHHRAVSRHALDCDWPA